MRLAKYFNRARGLYKKNLSTQAVIVQNEKWTKWWDETISNHPGMCRVPAIKMPEIFDKNASIYLEQSNKKQITLTKKKFVDILYHRKLPPNEGKVGSSNKDFSRELYNYKKGIEEKPTDNWRPIVYDEFLTSVYLVARTPACYATAFRTLNEIKKMDSNFKPEHMLDVGSGPCSTVWAANKLWPKLQKYYCVESSTDMINLSNFLFGGRDKDSDFMEIFIRQNFKAYYQPSYDIVNCAYTLSDLYSKKQRLEMLKRMWNLTNKYLVLIESGNRTGYSIIMEARELLLRNRDAKIFAPCPHQKSCPMIDLKRNCSFFQKYYIPPYARQFYPKTANVVLEKFSYIIFEKCDESELPVLKRNWPRVIDSHHKHGKCVTCHLCDTDGNLKDLRFKKVEDGTHLTQLARKADTGDYLPLTKYEK